MPVTTIPLNRLIKHLKSKKNLIITPRLDQWLYTHPEGIILDDRLMAILTDLLTRQPRDRTGAFSCSAALQCERKQMFQYLGIPALGTVDSRLQNVFNDGTWRHLRWQMMLLSAGIVTEIEPFLDIPALRLRGSMDGINADEGWGWELKGTSAFQKVINDGVMESHEQQGARYFIASDLMPGFPHLSKMIFIYEDKRTQEWREIVVERADPVVQQIIHEAKQEIDRLNNAVHIQALPPMLRECRQEKGPVFHACPYSDRCESFGTWPTQAPKGPKKFPWHPQRDDERALADGAGDEGLPLGQGSLLPVEPGDPVDQRHEGGDRPDAGGAARQRRPTYQQRGDDPHGGG